MWEESLRDSLDCFLGREACNESPQEEKDGKKFVKAGSYIANNYKKIVTSDDFCKLRESASFDTTIARVNHSHIELGNFLGGGAFSNVFEIKTSLTDDIDPDKCVVKVLRKSVSTRIRLFASCAIGLLQEGSILASLQHPNILGVQAFSEVGPSGFATGRNDACFIVLDKLDQMLTTRLEIWKIFQLKKVSLFNLQRKTKNREFLGDRLEAAQQLACAVAYLHERSIAHRDIKPGNIGFDYNGVLKLFDFDVSRIVPQEEYEGQRFKLTKTGTKRYMSPECGLGKPYNLKTDVYSFAIILHQILFLEEPFYDLCMDEIKKLVMQGGRRPKIPRSWPKGIKSLLKNSWCEDVSERLDMRTVDGILQQEINKLRRPSGKKTLVGVRTAPVPNALTV